MTTPDSTAVLDAREKPELDNILRELRDALNGASALGVFEKLESCHNTRRCWWQGQQEDGRMPKPAIGNQNLYWWEGAPESRRHKADEIVTERAGVRELVLHRGQLLVSPGLRERSTETPEDDAEAEGWQLVLESYRAQTERDFDYEWSLHCACVEELGYSVQHVSWMPRRRNDKRQMTREQFNAAVVQRVHGAVVTEMMATGQMPQMEMEQALQQQLPDEVLQSIAAGADTQVALLLMDPQSQADAVALLLGIDPAMSPAEAKRVLRGLRDGPVADYYAPVDDGGLPEITTCIPWVNCIHPPSLTGKGRTDMFGVPEWVTEADLRARAAAEGWDKKFVESVLEHPNRVMPELPTESSWALNGAGIGLTLDLLGTTDRSPVFQIIHVWRRSVNRAGLPMIFRTVVHPLVTDSYGIHECTRLRSLPFLVETAEPSGLAVLSRGVGQRVVAMQNQVMDLMNGEGSRAQLGSNPPLQRQGKEHVTVKPGMQLYGRFVGADKGNQFLDTPQVDMGAIKLIEMHEVFTDQLFFRGSTVDPDIKQQQRELLAHRARKNLAALVSLMGEVIRANVSVEHLSILAGRPINPDALENANVQIGFNVTGLSGESNKEWLEFLMALAPLDRGGRVDWGEVVQDAIMSRNPAMARRLVIPGDVAAEKIVDDQENRIAKIMAGVPVRYKERVVNPEARLEVQNAWKQVPGNIESANADPTKAEMMMKEDEQLQRQIQQYQENALTGKTQQTPNTSA